jgi:hypothetical protein
VEEVLIFQKYSVSKKYVAATVTGNEWPGALGRAMVLGGNGNDPRIVRGYRG